MAISIYLIKSNIASLKIKRINVALAEVYMRVRVKEPIKDFYQLQSADQQLFINLREIIFLFMVRSRFQCNNQFSLSIGYFFKKG